MKCRLESLLLPTGSSHHCLPIDPILFLIFLVTLFLKAAEMAEVVATDNEGYRHTTGSDSEGGKFIYI